ncbi:competence type IV pilus minor pilin ComGF [Staphylococcus debuckii]|uniref:Competence type IV pilus minor pilin ComGF n=1 Tax=Staphylococcus debuckii TaxID=2044912 RepID=A0ABU9EZG5_9STAP
MNTILLKAIIKKYVLLIQKLIKNNVSKNNKFLAFTLIETLFAFSIFCLALSLIPPLFQSVNALNNQINDTALINFEFFSQDITRELNEISIKNIEIDNNHLIAKKKGRLINYTFTKEKIYKTVDGKGNITLLQNIKDFKLTKINNKYIKVDLTLFENNRQYKKILII